MPSTLPKPAHDILLAPDGGPVISGGDIVVGPSSGQHIELITRSRPGDWRFYPTLGADLGELLLDDSQEGVSAKLSEITQQLDQDGAVSVSAEYSRVTKKITVQADYYA